MIGSILRKDWRLLWPPVVLVTIIQICFAWNWFRFGLFGTDVTARELARPLTVAWFLGVCGVTVAVVQQDALPALDQDWLVRPLKRTRLLAAKLLFVGATICLPMLLLDGARALAMGFAPAAALWEALLRAVLLAAWLLIPVFALAAAASGITELLILGAALVGVYACAASIAALVMGSARCPTCDTGVNWLQHLAQHLAVLLGACVVIALQYFRRATHASRILAVLGALALALLELPWALAFAWQSSLSPVPGAGAAVRLAFAPEAQPPQAQSAAGPGRPVRIALPVRVSGVGADELLIVDRSELSLRRAGGELIYRGVNATSLEGNLWAPGVPGSPRSPGAGERLGAQPIELPAALFANDASAPLELRIRYSLTLLKLAGRHRIAAQNGELRDAELGHCGTQLSEDGSSVALRCLQVGPTPFCFGTTLVGPGERRNPEVLKCDPDYRPGLPGFTDVLHYLGVDVPLRDRFGLAHYPVEAADLGQAYLLVRTFAAQEHFTRVLVSPRIRLADWQARAR